MNTTKETIKLMWKYAWSYPGYSWALLIGAPLTVLIHQFLPPLVLASVLDRLSRGDFVPGDIWGSFGNDILLYGALTILGGVIAWRVIIILIWRLEAFVLRDMQRHIYNHVLSQSASFHANHFGGSLVSQANKLGGAYIRFADTTVFQVVTFISALAFTSIILWPKSPLFVVMILLFSAIFVVTSIFITKRIRTLNALEAKAQNKQTGQLADGITNVMAIKSFAAGKFESKRFLKATEETRRSTMDVMWASTPRDAYFASVTSIISILALAIAIASVVLFKADIATVFLVLSYVGNITQRLWEFSQSTLRNYNRALGDAQDMVKVLHMKPEVKDPEKPEKPRISKGHIELKNVRFAHADAADDVLFDNLNLSIKPGERIGLVGHSGSGKTTLTKLLLRYNDINGGEITIDGQNIARITQDDLRRHIAYVPQEPLLFHRSIRENIAYGKPDATDEEIALAAKRAHAAEFIDKLPKGYDTLVGERGVKLSGGQRQRIAIARAMLKDAPILVLDEATSALDSESERLIQDALWELMKGRTAIVIAHRLSTVQKMDRILVLEDGKITEQGTHHELLAARGVYAGLWAHQSGGFIEE